MHQPLSACPHRTGRILPPARIHGVQVRIVLYVECSADNLALCAVERFVHTIRTNPSPPVILHQIILGRDGLMPIVRVASHKLVPLVPGRMAVVAPQNLIGKHVCTIAQLAYRLLRFLRGLNCLYLEMIVPCNPGRDTRSTEFAKSYSLST